MRPALYIKNLAHKTVIMPLLLKKKIKKKLKTSKRHPAPAASKKEGAF